MNLHEFNALPAEAAHALMRPCVAIDGWVTAVVDGRPYPDAEVAVAVGDAQAATWTGADIEAALADHPRIGERPGPSQDAAGADMSRREQAGVDPTDAEVARRLVDGNRRYEERFGRIYLVRAAGRDAEEMLVLLEERLTHDPDTELAVTAAQLAEIAALRLRGLLS